MSWFQDKLLKLIDKTVIEKHLLRYGKFRISNFEILSGWQNLGLKIYTNSGIFILRIQRSGNIGRLKFALDLIEYLGKLGFPVQKLFATKKAEKIIQFKVGKFSQLAVLVSYLEGETKVTLTPAEIEEVGMLIGKLHHSLVKFEVNPNSRKLNLRNLTKQVEGKFPKRLKNQPGIWRIWQKFWPEIQAKLIENKKTLSKKQLIHGDLAPSNILFQNSKISGILDFDDLILAPKIWDLANFVGNFTITIKTSGKTLSISKVLKNLISGYLKTSNLTSEELKLIPELTRFWFFKNIIWAKKLTSKKYRQKWAEDVISWSVEAILNSKY